jgi:hypothetical protein
MPKTTTVAREQIESLIRRINEAENARPSRTVEETIAEINTLMGAGVEGWTNGNRILSLSAEQEFERVLFGLLDDYHRDLERVVIDLPFGSFAWRMTSTKHHLEISGCTILEANEAGLMARCWIYFDPTPLARIGIR